MTRSVENEHFCLRLCEELGLDVAESAIVDFEDVRVLTIERFDRLEASDGRLLRLPQVHIPAHREHPIRFNVNT